MNDYFKTIKNKLTDIKQLLEDIKVLLSA